MRLCFSLVLLCLLAAAGGRSSAETASQPAVRTPPPGVVGPTSDLRLGPRVPEDHLDLNGAWEFRLDPDDLGERQRWFDPTAKGEWESVHVPGSWQAQGYGLKYHDVGWYRREVALPAGWAGRQVRLRFGGVATHAKVWMNGRYLGEHVGNWAPFGLSVTNQLTPAFGSGKNHLVVRVEERPDHFSAGFPRVVGKIGGLDSHFGGIWQEVSAYATGPMHLDDVAVLPSLAEAKVRVQVAVSHSGKLEASIECVILDPGGHAVARSAKGLAPPPATRPAGCATDEFVLSIPDPQPWEPDHPRLYTARVSVRWSDRLSDERSVRFGLRDVERRGYDVLLNGQPLMVRGILHWGYYPDLFSIDPSEERIRREFADLRAVGFNLVKVCLFLFPERFYEIADETGMLVWQEYPLWLTFPKQGDDSRNEEVTREYEEWLRFDRNHPSVILRDLMCEATKPNQALMGRIYRMAKQMTGGALVTDNSAFLNEIDADWVDDHVYRDVDDFLVYLDKTLLPRLRNAPEKKPFLGGECLDADTYRDIAAIRKGLAPTGPLPWWVDNANFRGQEQFEQRLRRDLGEQAPARMVEIQNRHAWACHKAYFEHFRSHAELAGYVMCGLRDITVTRPGFYDDLMRPKWPADQWRRINGDRMLILLSPRPSRCFRADEPVNLRILLSNYGPDVRNQPLTWRVKCGKEVVATGAIEVTVARGNVDLAADLSLKLPRTAIAFDKPHTLTLEAELGPAGQITANEWSIWLFPPANTVRPRDDVQVFLYSAKGAEAFAQTLPGISGKILTDAARLRQLAGSSAPASQPTRTVLVTDTLDPHVRAALRDGMTVVYLAPGAGPDLLPRQSAPFWREMTIWLPERHPVLGDFPHEGFVDLQFLDMTQRRPFRTADFRNEIEPLIWGTNARDPGKVLADYLFEARVGQGRLLACCLNLAGRDNVAGQYLLEMLVRYASTDMATARLTTGEKLLLLLK